MKTALALTSAAAVLATFALVAAPQDFGGRQGGRGGFPQMASPLVGALDTNRDGTIASPEIDNAPVALKTLDRNSDGRITGDELVPAFGRGGREGGGREGGREREGREDGERGGAPAANSADELVAQLMAFDKNGDGQLEKTEVPERMQGIFDRADANQDGKLTADEIKKSVAAAAPANAGGGREGFGREGREGARGPMGPGRGGMTDRLLTGLDTNKDGLLSADEIAGAPASLRTLDMNKDGQLTPDEYRLPGPGRADRSANDQDERNC